MGGAPVPCSISWLQLDRLLAEWRRSMDRPAFGGRSAPRRFLKKRWMSSWPVCMRNGQSGRSLVFDDEWRGKPCFTMDLLRAARMVVSMITNPCDGPWRRSGDSRQQFATLRGRWGPKGTFPSSRRISAGFRIATTRRVSGEFPESEIRRNDEPRHTRRSRRQTSRSLVSHDATGRQKTQTEFLALERRQG